MKKDYLQGVPALYPQPSAGVRIVEEYLAHKECGGRLNDTVIPNFYSCRKCQSFVGESMTEPVRVLIN
jgi:hypothetical protein